MMSNAFDVWSQKRSQWQAMGMLIPWPPFIADDQQCERTELAVGNYTVVAWRERWNQWDEAKQRMVARTRVMGELRKQGAFVLNLGECSDGSPFQSVGQAINEGRKHLLVCHAHGWGYSDLTFGT